MVRQSEACALAEGEDTYLEGFGGSEDGVIGVLAGVALLAGGNDGRVVHLAGWRWPDPFAAERGTVDVGKHLRPEGDPAEASSRRRQLP